MSTKHLSNNNIKIAQLKSKLLVLVQTKSSISNSDEIFTTIRSHLIQNLSTKQLNLTTYKDITVLLLQITSQELQSSDSDILASIQLLERIMFLFLFHFDPSLIEMGLRIERYLIDILSTEYSKELIQALVKITQVALIKRMTNGIISKVIITNISSALLLLVQITPAANKTLYDFLKQNYNEYDLVHSFCLLTGDEINFSNVFTNDMLFDLLDKYKGEFDKKLRMIQAYVDKNDNSISSMINIKQAFDKMAQLCKVIDALTIRGHRSYSIEKTLKNIIPKAHTLLTYLIKPITVNISLSTDTVHDILHCMKVIDAYDLGTILLILKWNKELLKQHYQFIINTELIVRVISESITIPHDSIDQIIEVVYQIVNEFVDNNTVIVKDNINVRFSLIRVLLSLKIIKPKMIINKDNFPFVINFNEDVNRNDNINSCYIKENIEYYSSTYDDSINELTNKRETKYNIDYMNNAIDKFEEFKAAMIKIYNLASSSLDVDLLVANLRERIKKNEISIEDFEKFFIESSMEMYKELFKSHI